MAERNNNKNWQESLKMWISGKHDKEVYKKTLTLNLIIVFLTLLVSILLFSKSFSLYLHQISFLGSSYWNPEGHVIFNIGFIIAGLIFIPHTLFLYYRLLPDLKVFSLLSGFFLLIASIGFALVGVFPSSGNYTAHMTAAVMAFGGIALGMIFMIFPLLKKIKRKEKWPTPKLMLILFLPLISIIIFTLIFVGIPVVNNLPDSLYNEPPEIWAFCEWLIAFSGFFWFFGIIYSSMIE